MLLYVLGVVLLSDSGFSHVGSSMNACWVFPDIVKRCGMGCWDCCRVWHHVVQVVDSVWSVLVSNVALLVNVIVSVVSMVFGGGTAILNTLLEVVSSTCSLPRYCSMADYTVSVKTVAVRVS